MTTSLNMEATSGMSVYMSSGRSGKKSKKCGYKSKETNGQLRPAVERQQTHGDTGWGEGRGGHTITSSVFKS